MVSGVKSCVLCVISLATVRVWLISSSSSLTFSSLTSSLLSLLHPLLSPPPPHTLSPHSSLTLTPSPLHLPLTLSLLHSSLPPLLTFTILSSPTQSRPYLSTIGRTLSGLKGSSGWLPVLTR